jgi:hypothetical protein
MKLLLRFTVLLRQTNRNASPVGVGRKGAADFNAPHTQRGRKFGLRRRASKKMKFACEAVCARPKWS